MIYFILAILISAVIFFPFIRVAAKRIILLSRVKAVCRAKGFKFHSPGPFAAFADGNKKFNFAVKYDRKIYAVSVHSALHRHSVLTVRPDGTMITGRTIPTTLNGTKNAKPHVMRKKTKAFVIPDMEIFRTVGRQAEIVPVILICPSYSEIRIISADGKIINQAVGKPFCRALFYTAKAFIGFLSELPVNSKN